LTAERLKPTPPLVIMLALFAIALAVWQLQSSNEGLSITSSKIGNTPITVFRPRVGPTLPAVVLAHGFAGSQQLMQPLAVTLARNGYIAVTFDWIGHGRNTLPMRGDITKEGSVADAMLAELSAVAGVAQSLPQSDGRLAVLGHSMATDLVIRFAQANPDVSATVAVSAFSKTATAKSPPNLLVIVGNLEPKMLQDEALRIVGLATNGNAGPSQTYGRIDNGTARRAVEARGVEHIGVLYSTDTAHETLDWLNGTFDRIGSGFVDRPLPWIALLFAGILLLAWPLSSALPAERVRLRRAGLSRSALVIAAVAPAILTPLILWKMPTSILPILLGGYLMLHFLVYGALTAGILLMLRRREVIEHARHVARHASAKRGAMTRRLWARLGIGAIAVALYNILVFGTAIDTYLFSFVPVAERLHVIAAVACGTLLYFIADETLTATANRTGGYVLTKICFLISLAIAILLNPAKLFFLAIIVPAILLLFIAFGIISRLSLRATGHPLPGAIGNAALFAWAIAVTFPMVVP
jgi:pimeloyl-ACP methyl ester carboxylesterase